MSAFYEPGFLYIFIPARLHEGRNYGSKKLRNVRKAHTASGWLNWDLNSGQSVSEGHTKAHQESYSHDNPP